MLPDLFRRQKSPIPDEGLEVHPGREKIVNPSLPQGPVRRREAEGRKQFPNLHSFSSISCAGQKRDFRPKFHLEVCEEIAWWLPGKDLNKLGSKECPEGRLHSHPRDTGLALENPPGGESESS